MITALRERALALNPSFNAFIYLLTPEELEPYLAALDGVAPDALPLFGVPFAIKDNIDLAGIDTTAACPAFAYRAEQDATIVSQLIALGAIPLGKTNLDQFATGLNGTRSPYGPCRNSVHPDYPSGGSSAGSSLAVALGLASFALGTDTAGSGRVPASLNNLVGLKATKGLISTAGVVPACRTLDCVTFFTATAAEASQLLALTARQDPHDEYSRSNPTWNGPQAFGVPAAGFRFGVPETLEFLGCAESEALYHRAKTRFIALGGVPVTLDFAPFLAAAKLLYDGPWVAQRYHLAGAPIERQPDTVLPVLRDVRQTAPAATPAPPVGPALGQHGVNIVEFTKAYNAATESQRGNIIPVEITVYEDRTFTFVLKTPPAAELIKKAAGIQKGSGTPNTVKVGSITMDQAREIGQSKMADLNANDVEAAAKIIPGTARSMGITVEA